MKKNKKSILWSLRQKGKSDVSYLLGTIHIKEEIVFKNFDLYKKLLGECEVLALEYDLGIPMSNDVLQYTTFPNGTSLRDYLTENQFAWAKKKIKKLIPANIEMWEHMKPVVITYMISENIASPDRNHSLDESLFYYAKSVEKEVIGLESQEEHFKVLDKIPLKKQVKLLMNLLGNIRKQKQSMRKMIKHYDQGDLQKLQKSLKKSTGALRKTLLYDRNYLMADCLFENMQSKTIFAGVGVGHLYGGKGMLRLLKHKGVEVKPIFSNLN